MFQFPLKKMDQTNEIATPAGIASYVQHTASKIGTTLMQRLQPEGSLSGGQLPEHEKLDLVVKLATDTSSTYKAFNVMNQRGSGGAVLVKCATNSKDGVELPRARAQAELALANAHGALCPAKFAQVVHADPAKALVIMERLEPHLPVRQDLWAGVAYPLFAEDVSSYLARALFGTSIWAQHKQPVVQEALDRMETELGNNAGMTHLTVQQVFACPFTGSTDASALTPSLTPSPALLAWAQAMREDGKVQAAVEGLKARLLSEKQCLLHGDLHTGNILSAVLRSAPKVLNVESLRPEEYGPGGSAWKKGKAGAAGAEAQAAEAPAQQAVGDLRIANGERSFLGPAGFDVGTLLGSVLLALASARARVRKEEVAIAKGGYAKFAAQAARQRWVLHCNTLAEWVMDTWSQFVARFVLAWDKDGDGQADAGARGQEDGQGHAGHAHGEHGAHDACCAPAAETAPVDPSIWHAQARILGGILSDAIGYAGCELARRVLGCGQDKVVDMEKIEPVAARAATEVRVAALAQYCIVQGREIAACVTRRALSASTRTEALGTLACGFDPVVTAAAALNGEPGWAAVDKGAAAVAPAGSLPGRPYTATLVMIAHSPVVEAPVQGGDDGGVRAFQAACVADLAARFSSSPSSAPALRRVWLYTGGEVQPGSVGGTGGEEGGEGALGKAASSWLASAESDKQESHGTGICGGIGPAAARAWTLVPAAPAPLPASLGLSSAYAACLQEAWGPVIFIRGDVPMMGWEQVMKGMEEAEAGRAYVAPLSTGGYGMLALPPHAVTSLDPPPMDGLGGTAGPLDGVVWSTDGSAMDPGQMLESRLGLNVSRPHTGSSTGLRSLNHGRDVAWFQECRGACTVDGAPFAQANPRVEQALAARTE